MLCKERLDNPAQYKCDYDENGSVIGDGFCRYDMTTADIDNMKLLIICLVSSLNFVLANDIQEQ